MSNHLKHHTLGSFLKGHRVRAEIGLRELARRIGKSPSWLSKVERDSEKPASETLRALCQATGASLDEAVFVARDAQAIGEAILALDERVRSGREFKGVTLTLTYFGGYHCEFSEYNGTLAKGESQGVLGAIEKCEKQLREVRQIEAMARG